mgnify:CR=1 FL=1
MYMHVAQKITAPIHRSTAYDFNVHLDHHSLHKEGINIYGITGQTNTEHLGVKEHEIVLRASDASRHYSDGRLRVFSALNNIMLDDKIMRSLVEDDRSVWGTTVDQCRQVVKNRIDGKYNSLRNSNGNWDPGSEVARQNHSMERVLFKLYSYVGVAITPQNLYPRHSKQDPQGFAATRGGLNTIINSGQEIIRPGQKIKIGFGMHGFNGRHVHNPSHHSRGIPHNKILVETVPERSAEDYGAIGETQVNSVLRHMHETLTMRGGNDYYDDFKRTLNLVNLKKRCDSIMLWRGMGVGNAHIINTTTSEGKNQLLELAEATHGAAYRRYLENNPGSVADYYLTKVSLDVINAARRNSATGNAYVNASSYNSTDDQKRAFVKVPDTYTGIHDFTRASDISSTYPYKYFKNDAICLPLELGARGYSYNPASRKAVIGLQRGALADPDNADPNTVEASMVIAELDSTGNRTMALHATGGSPINTFMASNVGGTPQNLNNTDGLGNSTGRAQHRLAARRSGDSLTYILDSMFYEPTNISDTPNAPGYYERPNGLNRKYDTMQAFVRQVVRTAITVHEKHRQKCIGVALSGARPGEPFDICLTEG